MPALSTPPTICRPTERLRRKKASRVCNGLRRDEHRGYVDFLETVMKNVTANTSAGAVQFWFVDWRHVAEVMEAARHRASSPIEFLRPVQGLSRYG